MDRREAVGWLSEITWLGSLSCGSSVRWLLRGGNKRDKLNARLYTTRTCAASDSRFQKCQVLGAPYQQLHANGRHDLRASQCVMASGAVFQMGQAELRQVRRCCEVANLDCRIRLWDPSCRQETPQSGRFAHHFPTDIVGHMVRADLLAVSVFGRRLREI